MGYNFHITRSTDWTDSYKNPIKYQEIINLVSRESYLKLNNNLEIKSTQGSTICIPGNFILWESEDIYLEYSRGKLTFNSEIKNDLNKIKYIANKFNAYLVGDEGELY